MPTCSRVKYLLERVKGDQDVYIGAKRFAISKAGNGAAIYIKMQFLEQVIVQPNTLKNKVL